MLNPIGKHAVVIGAGMGGLAAAKALAPYFEKATVLDRDALPEVPVARTGTPQARHAHALLAGGQKALETLFPGIEGDIAKAGAVKVRVGRDVIWERPGFDPFPRRDLGFDSFCLSRPLLESVCRRRLREAPNVDIRPRTRVLEVIPSYDRCAVAAVQYEDDAGTPETLAVDLVVDASGRAAPTLSALKSFGLPKPNESEIGIDVGYATVVFEIPDNDTTEWMGVAHLGAPPGVRRGGLILPMEDRKWIVSIGGRHGDDPPGDLDGFITFAKTFRTATIYEAIRNAKARRRRALQPAGQRPAPFPQARPLSARPDPPGGLGLPVQPRLRPGHERRGDGSRGPRQAACAPQRPRRSARWTGDGLPCRDPGLSRSALGHRGHRLRPSANARRPPGGLRQEAAIRHGAYPSCGRGRERAQGAH
jgi:2-polyprenyl-6-methoxyphenol hydroxylase-like FAD-dependent oxidoreductase